MASELLIAPAIEPLSLAQAKAWLRVEHDDDDDVIGALVTACRVQVEAMTRRALIDQTWRITRDSWPRAGRLLVLPAPVTAISAVRVFRADGSSQSVSPSLFSIDRGAAPAVIAADFTAIPAPGRSPNGIELDVMCGFGASAADVPAPLTQAIRLLLTRAYETREGAGTTLPAAAVPLLAPYKVLSL